MNAFFNNSQSVRLSDGFSNGFRIKSRLRRCCRLLSSQEKSQPQARNEMEGGFKNARKDSNSRRFSARYN